MKLVLHIGHAKTGTTALQNGLYDNRDFLAQYGVLYPQPPDSTTNHGALTGVVLDPNRWSRKIVNQQQSKRNSLIKAAGAILRQISDAAESDQFHTVVLSSEYFFRDLSREEVDRVRATITELFSTVHIIAYVRHPLDHFASSCLQKVEHAAKLPQIRRPGFRRVISTYRQLGVVNVRAYERSSLEGGDIVRDFVGHHLPDVPKDRLAKSLRDANESITAEVASVLQTYRMSIFPGSDDVYAASDVPMRTLLMDTAEKHGLLRPVQLQATAAHRIMELSRRQLDWLRTNYGVTFAPRNLPRLSSARKGTPTFRRIHHVLRVDRNVERELLVRALYEYGLPQYAPGIATKLSSAGAETPKRGRPLRRWFRRGLRRLLRYL